MCHPVIFGLSYFIFVLAGIGLRLKVQKLTMELPHPVPDDATSRLTERGRRLVRWDRRWERSRIPLMVALGLLYWALCA